MEVILQFVDLFLHLDVHLSAIIAQFGVWTYIILFVIIFCETGLVVTPILPGDSLLFAVGAFTAQGSFDLSIIVILLTVAAVGGDAVNYAVGNYLGPKVLTGNYRFLKKEYLEKTNRFYERYGGKTIIIARFVPIVRTFAPFLAGVGKMSYVRFASYNVIGGVLWIFAFILGGYFFGNIAVVQKNFTIVILAIIVVSVMPAVVEFFRERFRTANGNT